MVLKSFNHFFVTVVIKSTDRGIIIVVQLIVCHLLLTR